MRNPLRVPRRPRLGLPKVSPLTMPRVDLTKEEKANRVYDEMTFFVEKLERKYKVSISYNIEVE